MKLISFDVETSGTLPEYALQPFRAKTGDAWLTSVAWHTTEKELDFDNRLNWDRKPNLEDVRYILEECAAKGVRIVAWNTPFDVAWLIALGLREEVMACKWLDAMLLYKHLTNAPTFESPKMSYGLKAAVAAFYPQHANYQEDVDFHATDEVSLHKLRKYNKKDAVFTYGLAQVFWGRLNPAQRRVAILEAECIPLVADTMVEGLAVDREATARLDESLLKRIKAAVVQLKLTYDPGITEEILNSPKQLGKKLFQDWGLLPVAYTGTGEPSTDRKALLKLAREHKGASIVNEYRECNGNRTKFAANTLESIDYNGDDCTRPGMRIFSTYSGRASYTSKQGRGKETRQTGIALHQWKRDPEFRKTIKAPDGYKLLEFDFAGQEFRWMAVAANDRTMLGLCEPGQDAHAYMGARISQLEYAELRRRLAAGDKEAKSMRQLGKVANLCVAGDTVVLTDRGPSNIVDVRPDDLVWDGVEFVSHDGVVCSGVRETITYQGVTATPDHKVLVNGRWKTIEDAARYGWPIEPALGSGQSSALRAAVRIVGGTILRYAREVWGRGVGHRQNRQQRSLRTWKLALGITKAEPCEYKSCKRQAIKVYDIVNCGPRTRFCANGVIVHNSLQYRTSANRLREVATYQYDLDMTESEARAIHGTYQLTYYGVPRYWRQQVAWVRGHKYVDNMLGRRVHFKNLSLTGTVGKQNIPWEYASTAINYPIQSMGAEQKYLALAVLKNHLNEYDARFYFELHDGLFIIVPDAKAEKAVHELKQILSHLPYEQAWKLPLPIGFPVDAKIGPSWGELTEI